MDGFISEENPVPLCFAEEQGVKYNTFWKLDTNVASPAHSKLETTGVLGPLEQLGL